MSVFSVTVRYALWLTLALAACDREANDETGAGGSPSSSCPDDTIALADGSCFVPGVPSDACPAGFVAEAGGCNPVLPTEPCPPGQMAVPGMEQCAALGECGEAPWGRIAIEPETVFVDARYVGTEMGTFEQPYRSVQTAVDVAPSGGLVAIAAGSYAEHVFVNEPMRLQGRCAELVTLLGGTDPTLAALEIVSPGVEIRDLSISGDTFGVAAAGAEALLERVRVHDTPNMGIGAFDTLGPTTITVRDALLENNGQAGIYIAGAQFTVERSEIRDPRTMQALALPISLVPGPSTTSHLIVVESFVHGGKGAGVVVSQSTALLEATAVHDIAPLEASGEDGVAVLAQGQANGLPTGIELRGVSIRRCHEAGLLAIDADVLIHSTTVGDVKPEAATTDPGIAIAVQQSTGAHAVALSQTLVEATSGFGVMVAGTPATIDGLLVRGTPGANDGIIALTLDSAASAAISLTRVDSWQRAGISSFGADIVLGSSVLECNTIQLDGELYQSGFIFEDAGGNVCGCNGVTNPCKVVSSNLEPPQSF